MIDELGTPCLRLERDGSIAWCVIDRPAARMHVKRMLNERYGSIDYQTMFWALEHSPEPREGMRAFMEKRPPEWIPADVAP